MSKKTYIILQAANRLKKLTTSNFNKFAGRPKPKPVFRAEIKPERKAAILKSEKEKSFITDPKKLKNKSEAIKNQIMSEVESAKSSAVQDLRNKIKEIENLPDGAPEKNSWAAYLTKDPGNLPSIEGKLRGLQGRLRNQTSVVDTKYAEYILERDNPVDHSQKIQEYLEEVEVKVTLEAHIELLKEKIESLKSAAPSAPGAVPGAAPSTAPSPPIDKFKFKERKPKDPTDPKVFDFDHFKSTNSPIDLIETYELIGPEGVFTVSKKGTRSYNQESLKKITEWNDSIGHGESFKGLYEVGKGGGEGPFAVGKGAYTAVRKGVPLVINKNPKKAIVGLMGLAYLAFTSKTLRSFLSGTKSKETKEELALVEGSNSDIKDRAKLLTNTSLKMFELEGEVEGAEAAEQYAAEVKSKISSVVRTAEIWAANEDEDKEKAIVKTFSSNMKALSESNEKLLASLNAINQSSLSTSDKQKVFLAKNTSTEIKSFIADYKKAVSSISE